MPLLRRKTRNTSSLRSPSRYRWSIASNLAMSAAWPRSISRCSSMLRSPCRGLEAVRFATRSFVLRSGGENRPIRSEIPSFVPIPERQTQHCRPDFRRSLTGAGAPAGSAQQLGDAEGQVQGLPGVEAGIADRLVAGVQMLLGGGLGPPQALGDVVAGELDVHAPGPGPRGRVASEEAADLGQ